MLVLVDGVWQDDIPFHSKKCYFFSPFAQVKSKFRLKDVYSTFLTLKQDL